MLPILAFCQVVFYFTKPSRLLCMWWKCNLRGAADAVAWSRGGWRGIRDVREQKDCPGRELGSGKRAERGRESLR